MPEAEAKKPVEEGGVLDVLSYDRVRKKYGAEGAFPSVFDKARGGAGAGRGRGEATQMKDEGVDMCWRWKRDGVFGICIGCCVLMLLIVIVGAAMIIVSYMSEEIEGRGLSYEL